MKDHVRHYVQEISAGALMRQVSVTIELRVTGIKLMRARVWLGTQLVRLAGLVIGCDLAVDTNLPDRLRP